MFYLSVGLRGIRFTADDISSLRLVKNLKVCVVVRVLIAYRRNHDLIRHSRGKIPSVCTATPCVEIGCQTHKFVIGVGGCLTPPFINGLSIRCGNDVPVESLIRGYLYVGLESCNTFSCSWKRRTYLAYA
jgi:hypothetical protein